MWFKDDYNEKVKNLEEVIEEAKNNQSFHLKTFFQEIRNLLQCPQRPLALGKGGNTKKARICCYDIVRLLVQSDYDLEKHIEIFSEYYRGVKRCAIYGDYIDSNSRILKISGYVNWVSILGEDRSRLKISDYYLDWVEGI